MKYLDANKRLEAKEDNAQKYDQYCNEINECHICNCGTEYGNFDLCYQTDKQFDGIVGRSIKTINNCPLCEGGI